MDDEQVRNLLNNPNGMMMFGDNGSNEVQYYEPYQEETQWAG